MAGAIHESPPSLDAWVSRVEIIGNSPTDTVAMKSIKAFLQDR